jgi:hypothetical protein
MCSNSRRKDLTIIVAVTKLHASRSWKDLKAPPPQPLDSVTSTALLLCELWTVFTRPCSAVRVATVYDFSVTLKHAVWWLLLKCRVYVERTDHDIFESAFVGSFWRDWRKLCRISSRIVGHQLKTPNRYSRICLLHVQVRGLLWR